MDYTIKASNIKKLLKLDIPTIEKKIAYADKVIAKTTNDLSLYKISLYKRALEIILVSKKQNEDVNLQTINELINTSTLFTVDRSRN